MSSFDDRLDPEILATFPPGMDLMFNAIGPDSMEPLRQAMETQSLEMKKMMPEFPGREEKMMVPGLNGADDVPVYFYRRDDVAHADAVMIWLHGGGYVFGQADDMAGQRYAPLMTVISVDYRMAPEHRSPAAAEDVCAVLDWVVAEAENLGIDPAKIIVGGSSAGAGLAASAALMNRDRGGPALLYQMLIYPMLDDTHDTPSGHMDLPDVVWNRRVSMVAWSMYAEEGGASQYAAAARATDLSGLPPTYVMVGDLDLFRDEDIAFAQRLSATGIPIDLAVFPGAPHGFDMFTPGAAVSLRAMEHQMAALSRVLHTE
jgi:acetyl esterase/lipase